MTELIPPRRNAYRLLGCPGITTAIAVPAADSIAHSYLPQ
jgi:hypothetical protein